MKHITRIKIISKKNREVCTKIIKELINLSDKTKDGWEFGFEINNYVAYILVWNRAISTLYYPARFIIGREGILKLDDSGSYKKDIEELKAIISKWLSEEEELTP